MQSPQGQIIRPLVLALQRPKSFLCVTGPYRSQALADALKGPIGRMPAGMGTGVDGVGGITAGPGGWGEEDILCFLTHLLSFLANLSSPRFSLILWSKILLNLVRRTSGPIALEFDEAKVCVEWVSALKVHVSLATGSPECWPLIINLSCSMFSVQFSHSVMSDSLWSRGLQHTRLPCPSPTPRACSNSCPSSQWCHPATMSSSVVPFSSCLQSFPLSGSFLMSQFRENWFVVFTVLLSTLHR